MTKLNAQKIEVQPEKFYSARDEGTGSFKNMINELATPKVQKDFNEEPHLQKMDAIVAKAQASINKVILSPFAK